MFVTGGKVTKQAGNTIKKSYQKRSKSNGKGEHIIEPLTNDKEKNYEITCVTRLQDCRDRTPCDLRTVLLLPEN